MLEDDDSNPWRYIGTVAIGQPVELLVDPGKPFGVIHLDGTYFLHDDGQWYRIGEPTIHKGARVVAWRYAMVPVATSLQAAPHPLITEVQGIIREHTSIHERRLAGGSSVDAAQIDDPKSLTEEITQILENYLSGETT